MAAVERSRGGWRTLRPRPSRSLPRPRDCRRCPGCTCGAISRSRPSTDRQSRHGAPAAPPNPGASAAGVPAAVARRGVSSAAACSQRRSPPSTPRRTMATAKRSSRRRAPSLGSSRSRASERGATASRAAAWCNRPTSEAWRAKCSDIGDYGSRHRRAVADAFCRGRSPWAQRAALSKRAGLRGGGWRQGLLPRSKGRCDHAAQPPRPHAPPASRVTRAPSQPPVVAAEARAACTTRPRWGRSRRRPSCLRPCPHRP